MTEQSSQFDPGGSRRPGRARVPRLLAAAVTVLLILSAVTALEGLSDSAFGQSIGGELASLADPRRWVPQAFGTRASRSFEVLPYAAQAARIPAG